MGKMLIYTCKRSMALYQFLRNLQFISGIMLSLPAMIQALILLPLTAETCFRSLSGVYGKCDEEVILGQVSAAVRF
jgi:hypothetical protein